jgi:lysophospholipase L1-like esterase
MPHSETPKQLVLSVKKQVFFFLILSILLLSLAEGSIRIWAYFFRTSYERYNSTTKRLELVPNLRLQRGPDELVINSKGFLGPEFNQEKRQGVFRIISIGDSCTFTDGVWAKAYPALLERLLNQDRTPRRFEVINAGIEGYNSTLARARLTDEILRYDPDMVTIYIGWNDLMKTSPQDMAASGEPSLLSRIKQDSYLFKAYRKLIFAYLRPLLSKPGIHASTGQLYQLDGFVPIQYRNNLEEMIGTLKRRKVKAVLFTLPTVVTPGMSHAELRTQNVIFPYYVGAFDVASLLELVAAYNKTITDVAAKYTVPVVDLSATFNELDKRKLFWDTMHPSRRGHEIIAEAVDHRIEEIRRDARLCHLYDWAGLCDRRT